MYDYEELDELDNEPGDDDYIITDGRHGYDVFQYGKLLFVGPDRDELFANIQDHMSQENFWPNVWYQGERGDMNLLDGNGNFA